MTAAEKQILREHAAHEQRVIAERDFYLTVCTGIEITMLVNIGRDAEANGDSPELHWHRAANGTIDGIILAGHLSRETIGRVPR